MIFSLQEYEQRNQKCQSLMKEAGIDVMMLTKGQNIFYFSGYRTSLFLAIFVPFCINISKSRASITSSELRMVQRRQRDVV